MYQRGDAYLAKLIYNVITQKASWDCPKCSHINSFDTKEKPTIIECMGCKLSFPLDPLRYAQFEKMQDVFEDNLIEMLGCEKKG